MNYENEMRELGGEGTLKHYAEQLMMGFEWKMGLSVLGTILALLEGFYGELVWGFLALFVLDFISGIMKSKKNGIAITSKRLRSSVTKLAAYMVLLTALIIAGKYEQSFVPIVTVTYYYFMFTEIKSIIENVEELGVNISPLLRMKLDDSIKQYSEVSTTVTTNSSNPQIADITVTTDVITETTTDTTHSKPTEEDKK